MSLGLPIAGGMRTTRREVLRRVSAGALGLSLPGWLRAAETTLSGLPARADACIVIFLNGGPSHLDMWDMKPDAPDGIRGEFQPIASSLVGVPVSEHLPRLARHMHRTTLVRSMHHSVNNAHALAVYTSLTGHDRGDANMIVANGGADYPCIGATLQHFRPPERTAVPHVSLPYKTQEGAGGPPQPGFFGGFLGRGYDPLFVLRDPSAPEFGVPELSLEGDVSLARLAGRRSLLAEVARHLHSPGEAAQLTAMDRFQQRALDLLTSAEVQQAFALHEETDACRDAYGRNIYGQSVLLARRLVEAGTRAVTISWAPDANATWDTHGGNFQKLRETLLPQFDAACSSLLDDLLARGLLERTIVAVLGDFGRTPKINANNAGRDHWNYCYTIMLAGGGFREGLIYGASDKIGAFPADLPTSPGDVISTIYHALGIEPTQVVYDPLSRPHRLVERGEVVRGLLEG